MERISKILAPTDLSELSKAGVRYALDLAQAVAAKVTVYHVVSQAELMQIHEGIGDGIVTDRIFPLETYRTALTKFVKDHFSDIARSVKVEEKVEMGDPVKNIVELAKKEGSDLIVISTHGRTGVAHMLVGSVTEKIVRSASCPVLSVRPTSGRPTKEAKIAV